MLQTTEFSDFIGKTIRNIYHGSGNLQIVFCDGSFVNILSDVEPKIQFYDEKALDTK